MSRWSRGGGPAVACDRMGHREPADRGCRDGHGAAARRLRATEWDIVSQPTADVAIIGGGPGGYEAALVAAQLEAEVTGREGDELGGACVLSDCVASKKLIDTSETMGILAGSPGLGIRIEGYDGRMRPRPGVPAGPVTVDAVRV